MRGSTAHVHVSAYAILNQLTCAFIRVIAHDVAFLTEAVVAPNSVVTYSTFPVGTRIVVFTLINVCVGMRSRRVWIRMYVQCVI